MAREEEKQLEDELVEVGKRLSSPPPDVEDLLALLDVAECFLLKVDQSPSRSMSAALYPAMKALVAKELLGHPDMDVKVVVASCFSEITRITAPNAPYDDDLMKVIFQMIIDAFENLDDTSNRFYCKRVSILETVAKVRSCVIMLDLECDTLILEMFNHFLKTVRSDHPEKVFSSMESIMTLLLEESEDIPSELLSCLLTSVKKDSEVHCPAAYKLGEKVIGHCSEKLKPYLVELIQSMDAPFNDYSDIIASICQENSDSSEQTEVNISDEYMADDSKLSEKTVSDDLLQEFDKLESDVGQEELGTATCMIPKPVMGDGSIPMQNGGSVAVNSNSISGHCTKKSRGRIGRSDSRSLPDAVHTRRGRSPGSKTARGGPERRKERASINNLEKKYPRWHGMAHKESGDESDTPSADSPKKEVNVESNAKAELLRQTRRKGSSRNANEWRVSGKQEFDGRQRKTKGTIQKDEAEDASPKISATPRELDETFVGARIKVWWPDDKMFYDGIVASFNPGSKKHKIVYDDGDVEILFLKNERWEFIKDQGKDNSHTDASSKVSRKRKPNLETPSKSGNVSGVKSIVDGTDSAGKKHRNSLKKSRH